MIHLQPMAQRARVVCLALLGLAVGWQAQLLLAGSRPNDGWVLYIAAAALFVLALGPVCAKHSYRVVRAEPLQSAVVTLRSISRVRPVAGAVSIVLTFVALALFVIPGNDGMAWMFHLSSVVALLLAFAPRPPRMSIVGALLRNRLAIAAIAALLIAAFVPRIWQADAIPAGVWFDEARVGVAARRLLEDPAYRPVYIAYIERPAHHAYLAALSFAVFGVSVSSLRLVSEVFGVLNVLMAVLLFGRWLKHGLAGALVAGVLLAAMRYDLTFSRVAFDVNTTPFFMMFVFYFLDRGLGRLSAANCALAGMGLGFGLAFYLPMRIFAALLMMVGALLALAVAWRERSARAVLPWLPCALAFALGLAIAVAPVAEFALTNPTVFFDRNTTASIFYQRDEPNLALALWNNLVRYLGMFNYTGDQNGHHNLPGAPMLDPSMAVLFVLGLALAVRRRRTWPNGLMLLTFATMLLAGIFSADSEAPQALRVIGVLPPIIHFCALALLSLADAVMRWPGPRARVAAGATLMFLLMLAAVLNFNTYFNQQATDTAVWDAHSIEETWIGQEMARLAGTHEIILTWRYFTRSPTIEFFAPGVRPAASWTVDDRLPLTIAFSRPVVMFLDPSVKSTVDDARRLYPQVIVHELRPPKGGEPRAYELLLDAR